MKYLIIVESPSKCKKIENYLNELFPNHSFIVKASVGHIYKLALGGIGNMGIDINNNYNPNFIIEPKKKNVVKELKRESKKVDKILIATDLDYEGAKIGYDVALELKLNLNENIRIIFNEITKNALKKAFENPQLLDMNMVHSQYARRVLDRLIGFSLSSITAKKIQTRASSGRVLSATTQIIYDKEKEIENKTTEYYYEVNANFKNDKYLLNDTIYDKEYKKLNNLKKLFKKFKKTDFHISNIIEKDENTSPPKPFITSTINQSSPYTIKKTSMILQKLYQKGLITYIRTDSFKMSDDAKQMVKKYVVDNYGDEYFQFRKFDTKKVKGSQEAHECIRVTNIDKTHEDINDPSDKKIYNMIWLRTLECLMSNAQFNSKSLHINVSKTKKEFKKKINKYYFLGYKILTITLEEINKDVLFYDHIQKDDKLYYEKIFTIVKTKSNGIHYNESKLVKQLEKLGIGRPSTYSKTIENIQNKYYVEKKNIDGIKIDITSLLLKNNKIIEETKIEEFNGEKNKLVITELGIKITEFLKQNFHMIMDYNFTSQVESDLDEISQNKKVWYDVVDYYYKQLTPKIEQFKKEKKEKINILIGEHNNKKFYRFKSKWGPRIVYGEIGDKQTLYLNLKKGKLMSKHTLEDCIELLPNILGKYDNKDIIVMEAKSVYLKVGKDNYPLHYKFKKKEKNLITLNDALFSIGEFNKRKIKKKDN